MLQFHKINLLISYSYMNSRMVKFLLQWGHENYNLMIDSGAFTAWSLGKPITVDEYCTFLDSINSLRPFIPIQLDVIKNPEKTFENLKIMRSRGYNVMPVFTRGTSIDILDELYTYSDYICVGGIAFGKKNKHYVKWFLEKNKGRKVHLLGFTNINFIKYYQPTSVDTSSWQGASRFGVVEFYKGNGKMVRMNRKEFVVKPPKVIYKYGREMELCPFLINKLRYQSAWKNASRVPSLEDNEKGLNGVASFIGTISYMYKMRDIKEKTGTDFYLACSALDQLELVRAAQIFIQNNGNLKILKGEKVWKLS